MKKRTTLLVIGILALILAACGAQEAEPQEPTPVPVETVEEAVPEPMMESIVDIAVKDGRFTTLVAAVKAAGLDRRNESLPSQQTTSGDD